MRYPTHEEILELSESDRLKLIEDLWDTFENDPGKLALNEDHADEIDRRLEAWYREPNSGKTWDEVRSRLSKT